LSSSDDDAKALNSYQRGHPMRFTDLNLWCLNNQIIEVVVDEGTEALPHHIREIFDYTSKLDPVPSALLINRENDYSVAFSCLLEALNGNPFSVVAMVDHGRRQQYFSKALWPKFLKQGFFDDREAAIRWVIEKLEKKE